MAAVSVNVDPAELVGGTLSSVFTPFQMLAGGRSRQDQSGRAIPIDVVETPDRYVVEADIPGTDKADVTLTVDGDVLIIGVKAKDGKQESSAEEGGLVTKLLRRERSTTWQRRSLRLPQNADLSKITAKYDNGVLLVEIPKATDPVVEVQTIAVL